jgi:4-aminobutyrate aminotransferase-like enzyme
MPDRYRGRHRGDDPGIGAVYSEPVGSAVAELAGSAHGAAAFLAESVLSCAGQIVLPPGYLAEAYGHARAAGAVCIADEVQVGFGRVGSHFWGFETQDVTPDIVVMGKPAGNGHPIGIVVTTPQIADSFSNGMEFFSTFGGNPVSAAIGLAVLDVIERERLQWRALETGNMLLARLRELAQRHEAIGDVRGLGLFVGVELVGDRERRTPAADIASYVANRMRDLGVLLSTDGPDHNVLKIKPPLPFGPLDADRLAHALDTVLAEDRARPGTVGRPGSGG